MPTDPLPLSPDEKAHARDLQLVLDNLPGMIVFWDKALRNRFANQAYLDWFGLSLPALRGMHMRDVVGEPLYALNLPHAEAALRGELQSFERQVRHSNGVLHWAHVLYTPHLEGTAVEGFFVLVSDITERKQAEAALFEEKERAHVTLSAIGDGVITTDEQGTIVYLNPVAEVMSGCPLEDAIGQPIEKVMNLLDETSRQPIDNPLRTVLATGATTELTGNACLISTDGVERCVEHSGAPLFNKQGAVIGAILVFQDVTQTRQLNHRITHQATHDALTGLANRQEFERMAAELIGKAHNEHRPHVMLYLDLDGFKAVNDTCGHLAGDELLRQLAKALFVKLRSSDLLARLGGDEFGVLLPYCPLDAALNVAKNLVKAIKEHRFHWGTQILHVGVSIGVAEITAESGTLLEVLSAADSACAQAKETGTNLVQLFQADDRAVQTQHGHKDWLGQINWSLEASRFELFGQRIASLDPGASTAEHFEMLLRMRDRDGRIIAPGMFLPAAERYRLMVRIDKWVVHTLLTTLAASQPAGGPYEFSVNLSGASLNDPDFLAFVVSTFQNTRVPCPLICFEITETVAIANMDRAIQFIHTLRAMGCKFALDDFGSGLSSFAYLRNLPVDYLKIDGSFVRGIADDPVNHAMVEAICRVAQVMKLTTVAEFVETEQELAILKTLGVHYGQGYLLHRPEVMVIPGQALLIPTARELITAA
ncbi:MAG: EAL domain-containing protein [Pseudomonadota bacterium]